MKRADQPAVPECECRYNICKCPELPKSAECFRCSCHVDPSSVRDTDTGFICDDCAEKMGMLRHTDFLPPAALDAAIANAKGEGDG